MHPPASPRPSQPLRSALLALSIATAAPLAFADSVAELQALVDSNDAAPAWAMAQRMEPDNAGDPEFDFWYGLAAKAAGAKSQSVLAFERVTMAQPGNARAKLELADAYVRYGRNADARALFEEVLATTPPDAVQARIRNYLAAMEAADKQRGTQVSAYLTLAGGYDSNINSATSVVEHDLGPLTVALDDTSVESEAGFLDARAGIEVVHPVNQRHLRFATLSLQRRDNDALFEGGNFDFTQLSATGGWMLKRGSATWRIPLTLQSLWVESATTGGPVNDDRYVASLGVEHNRPLSARTAFTWFGQAGMTHYPSQDDRNTNQLLLGAGYTWSAAASPLRLTLTAHLGTEPAADSDFEHNGRDYMAARASLRYVLSPAHSVYGGLGLQHATYQDDHPVLGFEREEDLVDVTAGWQWQLERDWVLNADVSFADNESKDNDLYDFDRTQVRLGSTWRF